LLLWVCVVVVATSGFAKKKAHDDEVAWLENIPHAVSSAESAGKPVLVDIWAVWCEPCKLMDETTYKDEAVLRAIEGFVPLKVDADLQEMFIEKYEINAYPTVLILDGKGREITRLLGMVEAPDLLESMDSILSGYDSYLETRGAKKNPDALESLAEYYVDVRNYGGAADSLRRAIKLLKSAEPARRESAEIRLAETLLTAGADKQAAKAFERLAEESSDTEIRGRALAGMVTVNRRQGRDDEAEALLEKLRDDYPAIAERLN
jgi:thioredoxin-like negative regulator of GroEL